MAVSVAIMAGPPALVRIPRRLPRGRGFLEKASARSNNSSTVFTRTAPHCSSRASVATSSPWRATSAPVCDEAARAPASVRPDFTTSRGLRFEILRQICIKRLAFPKDSKYIKIKSVCGSSSQYSRRSLPETLVLLPMLTKIGKPDVELPRDVQDGHAQRAALRHEGNAPRQGQGGSKGGVHADRRVGIDDAHAIRPDHPHPVLPDPLTQLGFEPFPYLAGFGKARGDHHDARHAFLPAIIDDAEHLFARHDDDGQIHRVGNR